MRRREFIAALLAGAAISSPKAGYAQQPSLPVIGYLSTGQPTSTLKEFLSSLAEGGFLEGRNVVIEYRWAEGRYDRLPDLAAELVRRRVDVIVAVGGSMSGRAAKAATDTIPIVVLSGADPVETGFAQTLSRPGGNVTGIAQLVVESDTKRLQLLHELMPSAGTIAYLENPNLTNAERNTQVLEAASRTLGVKLAVLRASSERDFDPAFATISQARVPALLLANDPFFFIERDRLVALAAHHALPTMYFFREFVAAGGLISYGSHLADGYRQVGVYAAKILKGARPADLPIAQQTKIELVINLTWDVLCQGVFSLMRSFLPVPGSVVGSPF
jgi:putative tryptophan/tyrosine transport system substrate-binding protein